MTIPVIGPLTAANAAAVTGALAAGGEATTVAAAGAATEAVTDEFAAAPTSIPEHLEGDPAADAHASGVIGRVRLTAAPPTLASGRRFDINFLPRGVPLGPGRALIAGGHVKTKTPLPTETPLTPAEECKLLKDASEGNAAAIARLGAEAAKAAPPPIILALREMASNVLMPLPNPVERPWGRFEVEGRRIGEYWLVSDDARAPNAFKFAYGGGEFSVPMQLLARVAPNELFGKQFKKSGPSLGVLVKLLASGSWEELRKELRNTLEEMQLLSLDDCSGLTGILQSNGFVVTRLSMIRNLNNHDLLRALNLVIENLEGVAVFEKHRATLARIRQRMLETNLSVQLHPRTGEGRKVEAWHVLHAEKGAGIYYGLKFGALRAEFEAAARAGNDLTQFMQFFPVKKGQTILIRPGELHAMGGGLVLLEPQIPGGETLRIYDYGRVDERGKPRELHITQALSILDFGEMGTNPFVQPVGQTKRSEKAPLTELLVNLSEFVLMRRTFTAAGEEFHIDNGGHPHSYFVQSGIVDVRRTGKTGSPSPFTSADIPSGRAFIVPAAFGRFAIRSKMAGTEVFEVIT